MWFCELKIRILKMEITDINCIAYDFSGPLTRYKNVTYVWHFVWNLIPLEGANIKNETKVPQIINGPLKRIEMGTSNSNKALKHI